MSPPNAPLGTPAQGGVHLSKSCETCRFRPDGLRFCQPLVGNPNTPTSTKWLILSHQDARQEGRVEDCVLWEGSSDSSPGE